MITVLYFARLRETLGTGSERIALPGAVRDVEGLRAWLVARGGEWEQTLAPSRPVRARHHHQHDLIGGSQLAYAVDHQGIEDAPARLRLVDDLSNRLLGHARIMLERHLGDRAALVRIAHQPDEARHRADPRIAPAQRGNLGTHIEISGLNAYRHRSATSFTPRSNISTIASVALRVTGGHIPEQVRGPCSAPRRASSLVQSSAMMLPFPVRGGC